ncbi:MAG: tocopherol cyclase family protein [Bacteroidetes bacterium]|nr:tocopherol cyclase family protein [Bacteroidota bacterium]
MMLQKARTFYHPERFQGWGKKRRYFEGWYFKVVNAKEDHAFAFIPGIALGNDGNSQAFIQVLDGRKKKSAYYTFDSAHFKASSKDFQLSIMGNNFSENSLQLDLPEITGHLQFEGMIPWPVRWYSPGIMGPYAFVPFMECYHGIVSMDHSIQGQLEIQGSEIDFDQGRGYTEKDWGRSFPSAYLWLQSNHFSRPGISVKASVAKIPWIRSSFTGFIAGLWIDDHLVRFTTYNQSVLRKCNIDTNKVELIIENMNYRLEILAWRDEATSLASPLRGMMDGRIEESMDAMLEVNLVEIKTQRSVFQDKGRNAGLEVAGNIREITV